MAFVGTIPGRRALVSIMLEEAAYNGQDGYGVALKGHDSLPNYYQRVRGHDDHIDYAWRYILPNEVVFDVGDSGDWERCRRDSHLIMDVLNWWRVPYWGALSGGKGYHIHVFMEKPVTSANGKSLREVFGKAVVAHATSFLPVEDQFIGDEVEVDPSCLAPHLNSRLIREFGSRKYERKTLWTVGPGFYPRLPRSREKAYKRVELCMPETVERASHPPGAYHLELREALGISCPRGPGCFPGPESRLGIDSTCLRCPVGR